MKNELKWIITLSMIAIALFVSVPIGLIWDKGWFSYLMCTVIYYVIVLALIILVFKSK